MCPDFSASVTEVILALEINRMCNSLDVVAHSEHLRPGLSLVGCRPAATICSCIPLKKEYVSIFISNTFNMSRPLNCFIILSLVIIISTMCSVPTAALLDTFTNVCSYIILKAWSSPEVITLSLYYACALNPYLPGSYLNITMKYACTQLLSYVLEYLRLISRIRYWG